MRTFLLDHLAKIDPAAAAACARTILSTFQSPDEWALALRNYALGSTDADGRAFLQQKFRELLRYEPWQKEPSVGFLEAFDVAVHCGGTELVPDLAELLRQKENPAVAHAAYLALDRLVIQDAAAVLARLQSEPDLMQGREETRAGYFARADVSQPAQRQVLEAYLLNPGLASAELEKFARLYPNANFMVSRNQLSPTATPDGTSLKARDAEALRVAQNWLEDPRFASLKPQLEQIRRRLETFVQQANR